MAAIAIGYLVVVTVAAVGAGWLAPYDPVSTDLDHVLSGPSAQHLLGTDALGRDLLSRLMYGGQASLAGVAQAVVTMLVIGIPLGLLAGYAGGWADRVVTWIVDVALAVPVIVVLLMVLAVFRNNQTAAMLALGILGAPDLARIVRGSTLAVRNELYISAARLTGLTSVRIMARHVLPRITGPIVVRASLFAGGALLAQSGLSYLGLGVQPPAPTWGGMVADASTVIEQQPWSLIPPGIVLGLAILSFGLIGDAMRDAAADRSSRQVVKASARRSSSGDVVTKTQAPAPVEPESTALLSLRGVGIELATPAGQSTVAENLDLDVQSGEIVGLVGESGCGKSMTGRAVLGLLPEGGRVNAGRIVFEGRDLTTMSPREIRRSRGAGMALVSQDPSDSLDPVFRVGHQLDELVRKYHKGSRKEIRARGLELLRSVSLPDPEAVARRYPHELSGGMAQRVAIAFALAGSPSLLIADEPTTALDVTVQAEILDLLRGLSSTTGMAIMFITHDWGVVADLCDRAYVMYAGHVMESSPVGRMFANPLHPYTAGLLDSTPRRDVRRQLLPSIPGTVPSAGEWPTGCHFHPRCPLATSVCEVTAIPMAEPESNHHTRCIHHTQVRRGGGNGRSGALA